MKFLFVLFCLPLMIGINYAYGYGEISTSDFKIVNSLGQEINSPVIDQQLNLQTSLQNVSQKDVDWAYVVQVVDSNDVITDLNYATGSLVANQTLTTALSWTPHASGTYKIEVFVWDNLRDINPLAPMSTSTITVT